MSSTLLRFDAFELHDEPLRLFKDGAPCALGDKTLRILRVLAEAAGCLVSHEDLLRKVWPAGDIGKGNLRVHVHALQKALGPAADGRPRIINQPGQGYRFVQDVVSSDVPPPQAATAPAARGARMPPLPARVTRLVASGKTIDSMVDAFASARALVISGTGGTGKTSIAVALAERLAPDFRDGVCLVDLSGADDGRGLARAVAAALGLPSAGDNAEPQLLDALQPLELLLLLDNCEHLAPDVARLGNLLLAACAGVRLLVTSRCGVRVHGARGWRLEPLELPRSDVMASTPAEALSSPAVQLFIERALDAPPPGQWQPQLLGEIVEVCRRLDGLPLAIELAATYARTLGFAALRDGPHDRILRLPLGPRTNTRHTSLGALLDRGWALLRSQAADLLARLAVFEGLFDLEGVAALARPLDLPLSDTVALLEELVDGSWIVAEQHHAMWQYRMLRTTRLHALTRLRAHGAELRARRDHAIHLCLRLQAPEADSALPEDATPSWAIRAVAIDDVRAALDWFAGQPGDSGLVAELTIASAPLWSGAARLGQFAARVESALRQIADEGLAGGEQEMKLRMLKAALEFNVVATSPERTRALHRALSIARERGARGVEMTALWNMMRVENILGNYDAMNGYIDQIVALADTDDEFETALIFRLRALAESRCGRLRQSLMFGKEAIRYARAQAGRHRARLGYNPHAAAMANQALTLFVCGRIAESRDALDAALAGLSSMRNPASLCYVLADNAVPLAVWAGDLALARSRIERLAETAHEHGFPFYSDLAQAQALALQVLQDPSPAMLARARSAFARQHQFHKELLITIAPDLVDAVSVDRARRGRSGWSSAEILRAAALHPAAAGLPATPDIRQALLSEAASTAARQGAATWEILARQASLPLEADAMPRPVGAAALERRIPKDTRH